MPLFLTCTCRNLHMHGIQASDSLLSQFYKRGKFLTFKYFMHYIWKLVLFWCFWIIQVLNFLKITKWEWAFLIFKHFFAFISDMYMPKSTQHGIQASDSLLSQFYKRGKFLTFKYFMHYIWKPVLFWCFWIIQVPNFLKITKWEWAFLIFKHFVALIFDMCMPKSTHGIALPSTSCFWNLIPYETSWKKVCLNKKAHYHLVIFRKLGT